MKITHIPYRGASPAATAVAAGDVDFAFVAQITAKELTTAGKLRLLGVTSKSRSPALPNTPTMQELGLKDFEFLNWFGIIASAKTPPEIIRKIQRGIVEVLKQLVHQTRIHFVHPDSGKAGLFCVKGCSSYQSLFVFSLYFNVNI